MPPTAVYLCHPVRGGNPCETRANLERARRWYRWAVEDRRVAPMVSWIVGCEEFPDEVEEYRERGLIGDCALVRRADEVWLVGGRVSAGMMREAQAANAAGVRVVDWTALGGEPPAPGEMSDTALLLAARTWRPDEATRKASGR